ncbi:hypothetical protein J6590_015173 [Homalodisca vitripennis]|nr:hypothetical protein J6590_015173 [Homalodisca vitripennis]
MVIALMRDDHAVPAQCSAAWPPIARVCPLLSLTTQQRAECPTLSPPMEQPVDPSKTGTSRVNQTMVIALMRDDHAVPAQCSAAWPPIARVCPLLGLTTQQRAECPTLSPQIEQPVDRGTNRLNQAMVISLMRDDHAVPEQRRLPVYSTRLSSPGLHHSSLFYQECS